jgi:RNA polymerase sigma-54 factor
MLNVAGLELRNDQRQVQTLSPRLQHAVRLLQMSSLDFAAIVRNKLGENPFLEDEEGPDPLTAVAGVDESVSGPTMDDGGDAVSLEPQGDDRDLWQADRASGLRREDGDMSAMDMMAVETTLAMHLHGQLNVLPLTPRDLVLARGIVESLDDDGYLRTPLDELVGIIPIDPAATLDELQVALRMVQSLEPAGVAARSVAECLQLQLQAIECAEQRGLANRIVTDHLQALAAKDVNALAHKLGEDHAKVKAACDRIRRLDPRPGWRFGAANIAYVIPDVVVRKRRNQWTVQLNPAVVPRVRLNRVYADLFQRHRKPAENSEMAGHLEDARWTLRNVEQRFSTILDVATAIVKRQRHFLDYGPMAMKPLLLREIAEECGIHESTVSRVTNNKYMATPSGVFELKYFFSRAIVSANGSACSGTAIRGLIKDIIEAEDAANPLSDADIRRQLVSQGLMVARRTVTKYRQMLKIEAVERRRVR